MTAGTRHSGQLEDGRRLRPAPFCLFRTPLLPFDEFIRWSDGLSAPTAASELPTLSAALAHDRRLLRERLRAALRRPFVRDALEIASTGVVEGLPLWEREPESPAGQRIERALVRYFSRMCSRSTPFGLFAGVSVGRVVPTGENRLQLESRSEYQRHTTFDWRYLSDIADSISRDRNLRPRLSFRTNATVYPAPGELRFFEAEDGQTRLSAIEQHPVVSRILAAAESGARYQALVESVRQSGDSAMDAEEATDLVDALIDGQLLIPEHSPKLTGEGVHHAVQGLIDHLRRAEISTVEIERALDLFAHVDQRGMIGDRAQPDDAASLTATLSPWTTSCQVDLVKPAPAATIDGRVIDEAIAAIQLVERFGDAKPSFSLASFCERFTRRYGDGVEVALMDALDPERGIGFEGDEGRRPSDESSLFEGISFETSPRPDDGGGQRDIALGMLLQRTISAGELELRLSDADLRAMEPRQAVRLPESFVVQMSLLASSPAALAGGDVRVWLQECVGPSGLERLGRFCRLDEELRREVSRLIEVEEATRPDAIFAEIIHLPAASRQGNFIARPRLRRHEIPLLGTSGAPSDDQILVRDLLVSVSGSRVRLRSRRLGREVIPRLSCAHRSQEDPLDVYRFLHAVASQDGRGVSWRWGSVRSRFYPRVVRGRIVLSPACWLLDEAQIQRLSAGDEATRYRALQTLRAELRLPRFVKFSEGPDDDQSLLVDLDNALSVASFLQLLPRRCEARLEEMLSDGPSSCVAGPEGSFCHELLLCFSAPAFHETRERVARSSTGPVIRRAPPGSEWLYTKVYCSAFALDSVLTRLVVPLLADLAAHGVNERWFFIRYADPEWHLRLRFHGPTRILHEEVLPRLQDAAAPLMNDGLIWRLQLDTYEREIERYGGPHGIHLAEKLFHVDSLACLRVIESEATGQPSRVPRWQLALIGIDSLLDLLGLPTAERLALMEEILADSKQTLRLTPSIQHGLGRKFREERLSLEYLFDAWKNSPSIPPLVAFDARRQAAAPIARELMAQQAALTVSRRQLARSLVHMHVNRLMARHQAEHELVLSDLLRRLYQSRIARVPRISEQSLCVD